MRLYILPLAILMSLLGQKLSAQTTGAEVMEKVSTTYKNAKTLSYTLTQTYYDNVKGVNPLKTSKGLVKMSGSNYLMVVDGVQMIRNETFMVILNTPQKVLMVDSASATPPGNLQLGIPTDSLLKYMGKITVTDREKEYVLAIGNEGNSESLIKKTLLTVDKQTYYIKKITVLYNTLRDEESNASWNPMMVISYGDIKINEAVDPTVFSESRFIKKAGNKVEPALAYKDYEIINHLD